MCAVAVPSLVPVGRRDACACSHQEPEIPVAGKWISARGVVHTLGVETVVWRLSR